MYIKEKYIMHQIADQLIQSDGYEIIYLSDQNDEVLLEKYINRVPNIIRLKHQGFDWKNDLKDDIARTFKKLVAMENLLIGKNVHIYNIYVSTYGPVDDWVNLKNPLQYKSKKEMNMYVYYLTEEDLETEVARISQDITPINLQNVDDEPLVLEQKVQSYQQKLQGSLVASKEETQSVFTFGKPFFTYVLLIANIILFFIVELSGGSTDTSNLIRFGAKYNPAIIDGEWWRILSSMFLHIGFLHLFMNMLALYYLGTAVERIFGSLRFIGIYILAGIGGGVASFALTINVSAGASGAIFGLFGALFFFGLYHRKLFFQTMGKGVLFIIGINIIFGFLAPGIDNSAHLGGLVAGFIASAIFHLPRMKELNKQIMAFVLYCLMITILMMFGLNNGKNNAMYHIDHGEHLLQEDRYEEVILHASEGLKQKSNQELKANLYFQRSYAYIGLQRYDSALADLEDSISLQDDNPKSYNNLAVVYNELGKDDEAKEAIQQAYDLDPNDEKIIDLYENIMGESP